MTYKTPRTRYPGTEAPADFLLDIALNRAPGYQQDFIIGVRSGLDIADGEVLVWDYLGKRTDIPAPAAIYVSSTEAGDTSSLIIVKCLDENYNPTTLLAVLNGQSQVQAVNALPGGSNLATWVQAGLVQTVTPAGNVFIALSSTLTAGTPDDFDAIQSYIITPNNTTRNGAYMVPAEKALVLTATRGSTDTTNKVANITSCIRLFGQPCVRNVDYAVTPQFPGLGFYLPVATTAILGESVVVQPEKTISEFFATADSNGTRVFIGADIFLVDKELIGTGE